MAVHVTFWLITNTIFVCLSFCHIFCTYLAECNHLNSNILVIEFSLVALSLLYPVSLTKSSDFDIKESVCMK
jgi:hypothetical protein